MTDGDLPPLTYLTTDSLSEGVGSSQVMPYVVRLAQRGVDVTLHSFEKGDVDRAIRRRLASAGVRWRPHRFRVGGAGGGLLRVAQCAVAAGGGGLVHARSDLPAAACLLTRRPAWVWDVRGFWREDRLALGMLRAGSPTERVLRGLESAAARSSGSIVILSQTAADILARRFGDDIAKKTWVITTCVDLERFPLTPLPDGTSLRLLLAGSLSGLYDIPAMLRLVERLRRRRTTDLTVLTPTATRWDDLFRSHGATLGHAAPAEMPERVGEHQVGLSVRRLDVGVAGYSATPTKVGEFLACGRPVVVNTGLGDLDTLLSKYDAGVIVRDHSDEELDRVVTEVERLVEDPATPRRCRALAEEHFDVDQGVGRLLEAYRHALG